MLIKKICGTALKVMLRHFVSHLTIFQERKNIFVTRDVALAEKRSLTVSKYSQFFQLLTLCFLWFFYSSQKLHPVWHSVYI